MSRPAVIIMMAIVALAGCGNRAPQSLGVATGNPTLSQEASSAERVGPSEIEAIMLENYLQLALGNMEAYADGLARDREVVLVGLTPSQLLIGQNLKELDSYKLPFYGQASCTSSIDQTELGADLCYRLLPKNLEAHIYRDGSVAWVSDELSYRLPYNGKEAAIPIRLTAVLVREIDRWVVVMEHMSYGVPETLLSAWAKQDALAAPVEFATGFGDRGRAGVLRLTLERYLMADKPARARYAQVMKGREQRKAADPKLDIIEPSEFLVLMPGPRQEYRGASVYEAPSLAQLFASTPPLAEGEGGNLAKVRIDSYRLSVAANKRVAWMLANLSVQTQVGGQPMTIGLRATYVFAFDTYGWNIVQTHVSAPITQAQLAQRVFADGSPRASLAGQAAP